MIDMKLVAERDPEVHRAYTKLMDLMLESEGDETYMEVELGLAKAAYITGVLQGIELTLDALHVDSPMPEFVARLLNEARARALLYRQAVRERFEASAGAERRVR